MNGQWRHTVVLIAMLLLSACEEQDLGYGLSIDEVSVRQGYQSLHIGLRQQLVLSEQAREALQHGVPLNIALNLDLRSNSDMVVMRREDRRYEIRYLPLIDRYQLRNVTSGDLQTFSRLRHLLSALGELDVQMQTGALPHGEYELRTRLLLDEGSLPTPMQLPAWFSSQWKHDSGWSVWPVKISD